jgi:hypothetical protein
MGMALRVVQSLAHTGGKRHSLLPVFPNPVSIVTIRYGWTMAQQRRLEYYTVQQRGTRCSLCRETYCAVFAA